MNERPGFGDAEAKRIIKRAAEIDAEQGRGLDAPALREIAAEAGISPLAVDRALQEHEAKVGCLFDEGGERSRAHWHDPQERMHHALVFHLQRELHYHMALGG